MGALHLAGDISMVHAAGRGRGARINNSKHSPGPQSCGNKGNSTPSPLPKPPGKVPGLFLLQRNVLENAAEKD